MYLGRYLNKFRWILLLLLKSSHAILGHTNDVSAAFLRMHFVRGNKEQGYMGPMASNPSLIIIVPSAVTLHSLLNVVSVSHYSDFLSLRWEYRHEDIAIEINQCKSSC